MFNFGAASQTQCCLYIYIVHVYEFRLLSFHRVYFDNFFTSTFLIEELYRTGFLSCGTSMVNRRHFPDILKDVEWKNKSEQGNMRFVRQGKVLYLQWKDNKVSWTFT